MTERHLIIEKLRTWDYYLTKLPLYLRNSWGIDEHFHMLFELLQQLEENGAQLLFGFNVFSDEYSEYMNQFGNSNYLVASNNLECSENVTTQSGTSYDFDLLEKIAEWYGVTRYFDVEYVENLVIIKKQLKLTNEELLKLVLAKIILNNFNGSYEQIRELYNKINLPIYVLTSISSPGHVILYMDASRISNVTDNIKDLFKSGQFTLPSMGILYSTDIVDISSLALWDSINSQQEWDTGLWS